jgi:hypothetical protein
MRSRRTRSSTSERGVHDVDDAHGVDSYGKDRKAVDWSDACGWEGAMDDQPHLSTRGGRVKLGCEGEQERGTFPLPHGCRFCAVLSSHCMLSALSERASGCQAAARCSVSNESGDGSEVRGR